MGTEVHGQLVAGENLVVLEEEVLVFVLAKETVMDLRGCRASSSTCHYPNRSKR